MKFDVEVRATLRMKFRAEIDAETAEDAEQFLLMENDDAAIIRQWLKRAKITAVYEMEPREVREV